MKNQNLDPRTLAWRRLKKNKPALIGLCSIALAALLAILGYLISPDSTPNANNQMVDIQLRQPGFSTSLIKIRKNKIAEPKGLINKALFGQEDSYRQIPIHSYEFANDSIYFLRPETKTQESIALIDMVYAIDVLAPNYKKTDKKYSFNTSLGESLAIEITTVQQLAQTQIINKTFWLGTDVFGRDLLSRLLIGLRISLLVGLIAVVISLTIGIVVGALGGYFGGKVDDFIMLIINTVWSIPTLLLVFAIVLALGKGISNIFLAVGLTMWVEVARIVRGQVMAYKEIAFVEAAKSMGYGENRIIFRHILPNILGPILVIAAANFATAILIEAGLSYLGFGIEPPQPSWGTMLNENYGYALSGKPFIALVPALAIMWLVLAFNLLGNGLRDAFDVKKEAG